MSISRNELELLCVLAMRYTMGRSTGVTEAVALTIEKNWGKLGYACRQGIVKEASEEAESVRCVVANRKHYERIASLPVEVTE